MKKRIVEYGLLALLLWSPLPAASVEEWSIFVVELAVAVMAAAYVLLDPKPALNPHLPPVLKRMRPFAAASSASSRSRSCRSRPGSSGSSRPGATSSGGSTPPGSPGRSS